MALSRTAKLRRNRKWLVISGDASVRYGQTLGHYKTEDEARKNRPLFGIVRQETAEEVATRLGL